MRADYEASLNSPAFRSWLENVSYIETDKGPLNGGCDHCGAAVGTQPFLGDHCLFCAAYRYGRYEKTMELAIFAKRLLRTVCDSSLVDLAREVEDINWDCILPLADSEEATRDVNRR